MRVGEGSVRVSSASQCCEVQTCHTGVRTVIDAVAKLAGGSVQPRARVLHHYTVHCRGRVAVGSAVGWPARGVPYLAQHRKQRTHVFERLAQVRQRLHNVLADVVDPGGHLAVVVRGVFQVALNPLRGIDGGGGWGYEGVVIGAGRVRPCGGGARTFTMMGSTSPSTTNAAASDDCSSSILAAPQLSWREAATQTGVRPQGVAKEGASSEQESAWIVQQHVA